MSGKTPLLTVVGSANLDYIVSVPHHPQRGETVLGGDHTLAPGGKGANQAVAAARLGARTQFIGCIGADPAGEVLRSSLQESGVELDHLTVNQDRPSGIALISVDSKGDNAIVVSPGANESLSVSHIELARETIADARVVLLQLETPIDTVAAAARVATGTVILDPAPAPGAPLPAELLRHVDILVPNETELASLAALAVVPKSLPEIADAARSLPVDVVVVTLGARGALIVTETESIEIHAPSIEAVDTTAAGDSFRAALALGVLREQDLVTSVSNAVRVGAATAMAHGAQPSLPTQAQVDERLNS